MDEKHHLYPRFMLERFSKRGRIVMRERAGGPLLTTSPERAGKVGSFYTVEDGLSLPVDQVQVSLDAMSGDPGLRDRVMRVDGDVAVLQPGAVEAFLGYIEGNAVPAIDAMVHNGPPASTSSDRLWIALLVALQHTRGQAFRDLIDQGAREYARLFMKRNPETVESGWRAVEHRNGSNPVDDPIAHLSQHLEGMRLNDSPKIALGLTLACAHLAPRIFTYSWRVYTFDAPDVVTSDEAVGLWGKPSRDLELDPLGIGSADAVFFPLDSHTVLQMLPRSSSSEGLHIGTATKLRKANLAVATSADRWLFAHPDAKTIENLEPGPRPKLIMESVATRRDGDHVRELVRTRRA